MDYKQFRDSGEGLGCGIYLCNKITIKGWRCGLMVVLSGALRSDFPNCQIRVVGGVDGG